MGREERPMERCWLQCAGCGRRYDLGPHFAGCEACGGALEVEYVPDPGRVRDLVERLAA